MKINPMLRKELLVNVRSFRTVVLMIIFNCILALTGIIAFYQVIRDVKYYGRIDYDQIISLYVWLIAFEAILLAFIVPALTSGVISGERERQTLDILLTSALSPWSIISGKLMSCILSVILLIVSSVPVLSLIYVFGGIGFWEMLQTVLMLIYLVFFFGTVGIFCSAAFKKTTSATVSSYGLLLFIGLGSVIAAALLSLAYSFNSDSESSMLIMLINPAVTLVYLLMGQVGDNVSLVAGDGLVRFITEHWIGFSLTLQIILLTILLRAATIRIDPLRKRRRRS